MPTIHVAIEDPARPLPRSEQLAWRLAELAADDAPADVAALEMAGNRIIDNTAVALAALSTLSAVTARSQAQAFPRAKGANVLGLPETQRFDCSWAAWANGVAVRELDLHDNFYGFGVAHPADAIPPLIAVAQQCGRSGQDLQRAILTAYEVIVALTAGIDLNRAGVDHVAHLGPAVAAGLGTLLRLDTPTIFQAINHAAHVSCAPLQARKGAISSWKAAAPAHAGKLAIEAIDRAMRGQTSPVPIYEGVSGLLATFFQAADRDCSIEIPGADEPRRAILQTYPKAHAAGYHAQALIDLAFRMRERVPDLDAVRSVVVHTKAYTHNYLGTGSNDPEKMNPDASRETLDHSIMYMLAVALEDGVWHHHDSYTPERAHRESTIRLWQKISTRSDSDWTGRFVQPAPLNKDHGGRVVITLHDGSVVEDELAVPVSHPRGTHPFETKDYILKFHSLSAGVLDEAEALRFLETIENLHALKAGDMGRLNVRADLAQRPATGLKGIFDHV